MQSIQKKINSDKIQDIIDLPAELKHQMVIITVMPVVKGSKKSLSGRLSKYVTIQSRGIALCHLDRNASEVERSRI